jgi:hypothetical protein
MKATATNHRNRKRRGAPLPSRRPRIEETQPMIAAAALMTLAATGSQRRAARETGLSAEAVGNILRRNPAAFDDARKHLATRALALSDRALTIAHRKAGSLSAYQAVLSAKIAGQMGLEQLDCAPAGVTINVAVLQGAVERLAADRNALAAIRATLPAPAAADPTE